MSDNPAASVEGEQDRVATAIRLPRDLLAQIEQEAAARCLSRNLLITHLLRAGMERLMPIPTGPTHRYEDCPQHA